MLHARRNYQAGLVRERRKVFLGQQALLLDRLGTRLLTSLHARKCRGNPGAVALHELADHLLRGAHGGAHDDAGGGLHLKGERLAP